MGKAKNTNPNRKIFTEADIRRVSRQITDDVFQETYAIMFTVLRDKEGFTPEDLMRVHQEIQELSEAVHGQRKYCSVSDLRDTLRRETGIDITVKR